MAKCTFTKRNGDECRGVAVGPLGGCYQHDPSYELDRKRDAQRNGKRGGRGRPNLGTADLHRLQSRFEASPTMCSRARSIVPRRQ